MQTRITRKIIKMAVVFSAVILLCITAFQIYDCQKDAREESAALFRQIEAIMEDNAQEREAAVAEYSRLCLNYADAVAYMLQQNPAIMDDVDELRRIAAFMQVDEIHIFDESGTIVKGSMPQYFQMTVRDGEQIGYFAPMFEDKTMRLCQEITPNTSEGKEMQYAAVWSGTGAYVVQVGVVPRRVQKVVSKNLLPHIFSNLTVEEGTRLYVIDPESGSIMGAVDEILIGKDYAGMGIDRKLTEVKGAFHADVYGEWCYCVARRSGGALFMRTCQVEGVYGDMGIMTLLLTLCLSLLSACLVLAIVRYLENIKWLEQEVDTDSLTGLYNRRGLENRLDALFEEPGGQAYSAMIMLDADGLKWVNDRYGHKTGDAYLCEIARLIRSVQPPHSVLSRQGGDEFVLFYYGCGSEEELLGYIGELKQKSDRVCLTAEDGEEICVRYSVGYALGHGTDYGLLIRKADENMYQEKKTRKAAR